MKLQELINQANENAQEEADKYNQLREEFGFKEATEEWHKISHNYQSWAESNNIICESVCCFKGSTQYYQNRFYIRKDDGYRGTFSKAKALKILG